jgi:acetyl-CoA acetyltransferase
MAGAYDVVVAAGVEVMTRVPMGASMADGKFGFPFGPRSAPATPTRAASSPRASRPS